MFDEENNVESTAKLMVSAQCKNYLAKMKNLKTENSLKRYSDKTNNLLDNNTDETVNKKYKLEIEVETKNVELIVANAKIVELESKLETQKQKYIEMEILHDVLVKQLNECKLEMETLKSSNDVITSKQICALKNQLALEQKRKTISDLPNNAVLKQNYQLLSDIEKLKMDKLNMEKMTSAKISELEQLVEHQETELTLAHQQLNSFKSLKNENLQLKLDIEDLNYKKSIAIQESKDYEHELFNIDADQKQGRLFRKEVERLKTVDVENVKLRKENEYIKITQGNIGLLEEKLLSLNSKLKRKEEQLTRLDVLEIENKNLSDSLNAFKELMEMFPLQDRNSANMMQAFTDLQRQSKLLQMSKGELQSKIKILSAQNADLQGKLEILKLDKNQESDKLKKNEDKLNQLMKMSKYLRLERDKLKEIIDSFDSNFAHNLSVVSIENKEDLHSKTSLLSDGLKEINMKHCLELEAENEELKNHIQKMEYNLATVRRNESHIDVQNIKTASSSTDESIIHELRMKIENLVNQSESLFKENETNKCFIEWLKNQGIHDPHQTRIICLAENPASMKRKKINLELETLKVENAKLKAKLDLLINGDNQVSDISTIAQLKAQDHIQNENIINDLKSKLERSEKIELRLKEAFTKTSSELRHFLLSCLGYKVDVVDTRKYKLMSFFAESKNDFLHFTMTKEGVPTIEDSDYCQSFPQLIDQYLKKGKSIPSFMAGLTLELFNRQTMLASSYLNSDCTESLNLAR